MGNKSFTGGKHPKEWSEKMSAKTKGISRPWKEGRVAWNKGLPAWNKGIHQTQTMGENNPNWKGGITPKYRAIRTTLEYKLWRKAVFDRDNYTCVLCNTSGVYLNADHIKPLALYPESIYDISNGRTLCLPCHKLTDTYGRKTKTM